MKINCNDSKKQTDISCIPENWDFVLLGKLCQVKSSSISFQEIENIDTRNPDFPRVLALKVSDMNSDVNKYTITKSNIEFYPDPSRFNFGKCIPRKAIIFPKRGAAIATNKKRLLGEIAILDPNLIAVIPSEEFIPEFLYHYFLTIDLIKFTEPGCLPQLNKKDLEPAYLPKPPLEEQRKIAGVLSLVQDAIAQQEQLITLTTELKKALMQKLFTEGTRGEPQKKTEIGFIPHSWDVVKLKDTAESFQYGTSVKCDYDKDGKPVLRIPNVIGGYIDISDLKYGQPKPNEIQSLKLLDGDLLFVRTNGTKENSGRCSIYRDELGNDCYFASYLIRVRLNKDKLLPTFLDEYTRTDIGTSFLSGQAIRTADGKFNINSGTLQRMLVPQASLDEQIEIADILSKLDTQITNYLLIKKQLQDLFYTLLHQLMTAQIRVDNLNISTLNLELQGGD